MVDYRLIVASICTLNNKLIRHDVEYKDQVSVEHFFSESNMTSDLKRKIEIKLFNQCAFASGSRLMGIIRIHLMIYFLECTSSQDSSIDNCCQLLSVMRKSCNTAHNYNQYILDMFLICE